MLEKQYNGYLLSFFQVNVKTLYKNINMKITFTDRILSMLRKNLRLLFFFTFCYLQTEERR